MKALYRFFFSALPLVAAGLFCVSVNCLAQGSQRQSIALGNVSSNARILAYAQVKVCSYDPTNPTACVTTVTLYKDPAMSQPYPSNPIQADKNGNYAYWVPAGNYVEQMCATGSQCQTQVVTLGGSGGGGNPLPLKIPATDVLNQPARVAGALDIVTTGDTNHPAFQTNTLTPTIYLQTTFNEGAVSSNFIGTHPAVCQNGCTGVWTPFDTATSATFTASGVTFGGIGTQIVGGPAINVGHNNYVIHLIVPTTGVGGTYPAQVSIGLRVTDGSNGVWMDFSGANTVTMYDVVAGSGTQKAAGNLNLQNLTITAQGSTISVTDGSGTTLTGTFTDNLTATNISLTQNLNSGGTFSSLIVQGLPTTSSGSCVGYLNADTTCSTGGTSAVVAADLNGHIANLPEIGTATDPNTGAVTIAWMEDHLNGKFDCRDTKYDGGCLGPTPGLALQDMRNDMVCYESLFGRHPETEFPNAVMKVGTPGQPNLTWPTGAYYHGSYSINGLGTTFQATYNNYFGMQFNTGQSAICADGHLHAAYLTAGTYIGFGEAGCATGNCVNVPGDNGSYPNGGPNQNGIFIGDSQGYVHLVAATGNGGSGLQIDGIDSQVDKVWGYNNMFWYLFGKNQSGQTYNPTTDGWHCNILDTGVDNRITGAETYGTNNAVGNEYGHVCGIYWGGGNSYLADIFSQVDEIGVVRPSGNDRGRLIGGRIEASRGELIYTNSNTNTIQGVQLTSACRDSGVAALNGGHCDYIDDFGNDNVYVGDHMSNDGYFGTDYSTGGIWPAGASSFVSTYGEKVENVYGQLGLNNIFNIGQPNNFGGGVAVSGSNPDITGSSYISWSDTAPVMVTGVQNARIMQDIWITTTYSSGGVFVPNTNVTLVSTVNGGSWQTCDGQNINFTRAAVLHFVVQDLEAFHRYTEQCDEVPQNYAHLNYPGNTAPTPSLQGTLDAFGSGFFRPNANLAALTVAAPGATNAYTYCVAMKVFGWGGIETTANSCGNIPPAPPTGGTYAYQVSLAIPAGYQHYELYMTSTDPGLTSGLVDQGDAGSSFGLPLSYLKTIPYQAPINTNTIGVAYSLNTTGGFAEQAAIPGHSTEPCQDNEVRFGAAPASGGTVGWYRCHPANTWIYYALSPTTTSW